MFTLSPRLGHLTCYSPAEFWWYQAWGDVPGRSPTTAVGSAFRDGPEQSLGPLKGDIVGAGSLLRATRGRTYGPGAILDFDVLAQFARHDRFLALESHTEFLLLYDYIKILPASSFRHRDLNVYFSELLLPCVR